MEITRGNIEEQYQFMSDVEREEERELLHSILEDRSEAILKVLEVDYSDCLSKKLISYSTDNIGHHFLSFTFFGVVDMLNPIDEYIAEINASEAYKSHIKPKCLLCGGTLKKEETNLSEYTCEDCDCLQNEDGTVQSDIPFYLANYTTEENIEIFQNFDEAKKCSVNGMVYKATLNHENVYFEKDIGWNYEDNFELFLDEPTRIIEK